MDTGGKGGSGTTGDGKERTDGEIQQAGKYVAVALAHLVCQRLQTVRVGVADGRNAQNGNTYCGDDKANHGGQDIPTGQLTQMYRENQISRTEKHTEQCGGNQNPLFQIKPLSHEINS